MTTFSVGNINPGTVRNGFLRSMLGLKDLEFSLMLADITHPERDRTRFEYFTDHVGGPYLDSNRNQVVEAFLDAMDSDRLIFVDSDVAPHPEQLYILATAAHAYDLPYLSGVYYSADDTNGIFPVVYRWADNDFVPYAQADLDAMDDKPQPVASTGAGLLCLSRELLVEMATVYPLPSPWFVAGADDGHYWGEDHGLARRVTEMGYQPHVLPHLVAPHVKSATFGPAATTIRR